MYIEAMSVQINSGESSKTFPEPGRIPIDMRMPRRTAVVPEPGMPSVSIGISEPPAAALFADSGAATPRMSPWPNVSSVSERRFSMPYDMKPATDAPVPGSRPMKKPMKVPRMIAPRENMNSLKLTQTRSALTNATSSPLTLLSSNVSTSLTAKSPMAMMTKSMPSWSLSSPNVYRVTPDWRSVPTVDSITPNSTARIPLRMLLPARLETVAKASTTTMNFSGDWNSVVTCDSGGPNSISPTTAPVPAMNDPIAAMARAEPARPCLDI